jgi:hypothetical protein
MNMMYHIYCETEDCGETLTPSYSDAMRQLRKLVRQFPDAEIFVDKLHDFIDMADFGKRELVCHYCPD